MATISVARPQLIPNMIWDFASQSDLINQHPQIGTTDTTVVTNNGSMTYESGVGYTGDPSSSQYLSIESSDVDVFPTIPHDDYDFSMIHLVAKISAASSAVKEVLVCSDHLNEFGWKVEYDRSSGSFVVAYANEIVNVDPDESATLAQGGGDDIEIVLYTYYNGSNTEAVAFLNGEQVVNTTVSGDIRHSQSYNLDICADTGITDATVQYFAIIQSNTYTSADFTSDPLSKWPLPLVGLDVTALPSGTASTDVTASPSGTASTDVTASPTGTASADVTSSPSGTASTDVTASPTGVIDIVT